MKITKEKDDIVIRIPVWKKRYNPYMEGQDVGEYQTLIGLIDKDKWGNDEIGFALNIDMSYKGKGDQWTDIMIHYWEAGGIEDFKKLCVDLGIDCLDLRMADKDTNYEED